MSLPLGFCAACGSSVRLLGLDARLRVPLRALAAAWLPVAGCLRGSRALSLPSSRYLAVPFGLGPLPRPGKPAIRSKQRPNSYRGLRFSLLSPRAAHSSRKQQKKAPRPERICAPFFVPCVLGNPRRQRRSPKRAIFLQDVRNGVNSANRHDNKHNDLMSAMIRSRNKCLNIDIVVNIFSLTGRY